MQTPFVLQFAAAWAAISAPFCLHIFESPTHFLRVLPSRLSFDLPSLLGFVERLLYVVCRESRK